MLSFLCKDQRDWKEPGHLKLLNALQEDAGNNFSYLVPMNVVNKGEGPIYPGVKCPPPSTLCILSFLCNDQRDWEEPGHLKFLNALQEDAVNFSYVVLKKKSIGQRGNLPRGKVPPPSSTLMYVSFLCNDKGSFEVSECPQEDTGNNLSYLVPMNTVNICLR